MKKSYLIFAIFCLFLFSSCRCSEEYNFLNPTDAIEEIAIVNLHFGDDGYLIETKIKTIENVNEFLNDFQRVDCYTYFGDPIPATPEGIEDTVIKILYKNNEYELINWNGQSEYTLKKGLTYYAGYSVFDEYQFEALIKKYLDRWQKMVQP